MSPLSLRRPPGRAQRRVGGAAAAPAVTAAAAAAPGRAREFGFAVVSMPGCVKATHHTYLESGSVLLCSRKSWCIR
eukprot:5704111-Pleurochrysis_carterae.AAC.1